MDENSQAAALDCVATLRATLTPILQIWIRLMDLFRWTNVATSIPILAAACGAAISAEFGYFSVTFFLFLAVVWTAETQPQREMSMCTFVGAAEGVVIVSHAICSVLAYIQRYRVLAPVVVVVTGYLLDSICNALPHRTFLLVALLYASLAAPVHNLANRLFPAPDSAVRSAVGAITQPIRWLVHLPAWCEATGRKTIKNRSTAGSVRHASVIGRVRQDPLSPVESEALTYFSEASSSKTGSRGSGTATKRETTGAKGGGGWFSGVAVNLPPSRREIADEASAPSPHRALLAPVTRTASPSAPFLHNNEPLHNIGLAVIVRIGEFVSEHKIPVGSRTDHFLKQAPNEDASDLLRRSLATLNNAINEDTRMLRAPNQAMLPTPLIDALVVAIEVVLRTTAAAARYIPTPQFNMSKSMMSPLTEEPDTITYLRGELDTFSSLDMKSVLPTSHAGVRYPPVLTKANSKQLINPVEECDVWAPLAGVSDETTEGTLALAVALQWIISSTCMGQPVNYYRNGNSCAFFGVASCHLYRDPVTTLGLIPPPIAGFEKLSPSSSGRLANSHNTPFVKLSAYLRSVHSTSIAQMPPLKDSVHDLLTELARDRRELLPNQPAPLKPICGSCRMSKPLHVLDSPAKPNLRADQWNLKSSQSYPSSELISIPLTFERNGSQTSHTKSGTPPLQSLPVSPAVTRYPTNSSSPTHSPNSVAPVRSSQPLDMPRSNLHSPVVPTLQAPPVRQRNRPRQPPPPLDEAIAPAAVDRTESSASMIKTVLSEPSFSSVAAAPAEEASRRVMYRDRGSSRASAASTSSALSRVSSATSTSKKKKKSFWKDLFTI